jgi:hypothetical protein
MRSRLTYAWAVLLTTGGVLTTALALASVSIAVTWNNLLKQSSAALIGTPIDASAAWQTDHIYTSTRVKVDRVIASATPLPAEITVRTMGGIVGDVGQRVEGEPTLQPGQPCLFFLHAGPGGTFEVTARAQGQYLVVSDASKMPVQVLRAVEAGAVLLPQNGAPTVLARQALHERPAEDAVRDIVSSWGALHAR